MALTFDRVTSRQIVQCPCRALSSRPNVCAPAARLHRSSQLRTRQNVPSRPCRLSASQDGQQSQKSQQGPQQPEVQPESIPADEATEADETFPATPPAADASAPQASSKAQTDSKAKKGPQPPKPKGAPDYDKAGPLADWLKDAAKEMKKQGVNQRFTDSFLGELVDEFSMQFAATEATHAQAQVAAATALQVSKDQYIRLNADFENFRRRTAGEKLSLRDSTKGDVIMKLVPLIDNFEAAKNAVKVQSDAEQKIVDSYQGLYKQMVQAFRDLGVEAVPGVGHPFDPNFHEAIMQEPNDDVPDGTILQEFRKGFQCGDRLLRAAMVKVSSSDVNPAKKAASTAAAANGGEGGNVEVEDTSTVDAGAKFD